MKKNRHNSIDDYGSVFPDAASQLTWSNEVFARSVSGQVNDQEWRVGEGYAVTTFEHKGIPALVIVPWGGNDAPQEWIKGPILWLNLGTSALPVVSYLPKHSGDCSAEDALRLFRNGKGFVGRLGNAALYEEFNRSSWGTKTEITQRLRS